jgi:hypothetical protein
MDIGKFKLQLAQTFSGDTKKALTELFLAAGQLGQELAITPGTARILASAAITKGQAVNINSGQVRPADASLSRPAIGIASKGASAGQYCTLIIGSGYISGLSALTANSSIYLGNAGALLFAKPGSGMIQGLGFSLSATELFVTISQP